MVYCLLCAAVIIILLCVRIYLLKKSARNMFTQFADRLENDTNSLIHVSTNNKDMRYLASIMNDKLKVVREKQIHYEYGNSELKNAITNVSHDLRTPLTAISGYLEMIQRTNDIEQIRNYLMTISERTESMKQLTEELFRYSMILTEDTEIEMHDVNLNQILEDSIMGYFCALEEKGIVPNVNITEKIVIKKLNQTYVSRIISNMLSNALKYSDGDLDIMLSDDGEIVFSNTAKKLSHIQVGQLFDRFYTVEIAHNSTGLGLSIARTLVERMNGKITAEYNNSRLTIRITL